MFNMMLERLKSVDRAIQVGFQNLEAVLLVLVLIAIPLSVAAVKWGVSLAVLVKFFSLE